MDLNLLQTAIVTSNLDPSPQPNLKDSSSKKPQRLITHAIWSKRLFTITIKKLWLSWRIINLRLLRILLMGQLRISRGNMSSGRIQMIKLLKSNSKRYNKKDGRNSNKEIQSDTQRTIPSPLQVVRISNDFKLKRGSRL